MKNICFCNRVSWRFLTVLFFIYVSISSSLYSQQDEKLPLNTVIEKVICRADSGQSYTLFLPPNYSPEKKWPIIYALDPGARGEVPVKLFQEAAARYGYIVAGSNNSQNGPWEPIIKAIKADWEDTHSRFSIDEKRIYSAGFSGGARAAALMTKLAPSPITGCIMFGAGLPSEIELRNVKSIYFIGVVGLKDFNYIEMMELRQKMNREAVPHRIIVTDGYHSWPDGDICTRIVEWLEIHAMSAGKAAKNEDFIEDLYDKELSAGRALEKEKEFYRAYFHYAQVLPLFKELLKTDNLERRITKATDNPEYYRQSMNDLTSRQTEIEILGRIYPILLDFEKRPLDEIEEKKYLKELDFFSFNKYMQIPDNPDMAYMAIRLMSQISAQLSGAGWNAMENKEYLRATMAFKICLKTVENEPVSRQAYYEISIACAYGASNDSRNALKYLKLGVEHGYNKLSFLLDTDYFINLREMKEFKEILNKIKP
jgi:predicted esterase